MSQHKVSRALKAKILDEIIEPYYYADIDHVLSDKKCWRVTGSIFETISKILVSFGAILSFSSGYYNYATLSFISGATSTISLAFLQFSAFCYKEEKRNMNELNAMLKELNIEMVASFDDNKQIILSQPKQSDIEDDNKILSPKQS